MIPEDAVEAGWIAYLASERDGLDRIRAILEAAAPYMLGTPEELRDGIWTMTETEFKESLRAAKQEAWAHGATAALIGTNRRYPVNPYRTTPRSERTGKPPSASRWPRRGIGATTQP